MSVDVKVCDGQSLSLCGKRVLLLPPQCDSMESISVESLNQNHPVFHTARRTVEHLKCTFKQALQSETLLHRIPKGFNLASERSTRLHGFASKRVQHGENHTWSVMPPTSNP